MAIFSTIGNILQGNSAERAARAQGRAASNATNRALNFMEEGRDLSFDFLQPFYDSGQEGLQAYSDFVMGRSNNVPINQEALDFRLNEGLGTLQNKYSAMGGFSGNQAKAMERYRMGLVTDEQDRSLARLSGIAGMGQQAAGGLAGAATGIGGNMGQTALSGGLAAGQANASAFLNNPAARAFGGLGQTAQAGLGLFT